MSKGTFHVESELAVSIRKTLDNAEERMDSMFDDDALCEDAARWEDFGYFIQNCREYLGHVDIGLPLALLDRADDCARKLGDETPAVGVEEAVPVRGEQGTQVERGPLALTTRPPDGVVSDGGVQRATYGPARDERRQWQPVEHKTPLVFGQGVQHCLPTRARERARARSRRSRVSVSLHSRPRSSRGLRKM